MIAANELRVGNWVNIEFLGPHQWEYTDFEDYVKDAAHGWDVDGCIISDKIEPIPLTPEILEGCIMGKDICLRSGAAGNKFYVSYNGFNDDLKHYVIENEFKYVHQLQNLYFALTNTELQINIDKLQKRK